MHTQQIHKYTKEVCIMVVDNTSDNKTHMNSFCLQSTYVDHNERTNDNNKLIKKNNQHRKVIRNFAKLCQKLLPDAMQISM